jgi:hypothetical protein
MHMCGGLGRREKLGEGDGATMKPPQNGHIFERYVTNSLQQQTTEFGVLPLSTPKTSRFGLKIMGCSGSVLNFCLPKKPSPEKV